MHPGHFPMQFASADIGKCCLLFPNFLIFFIYFFLHCICGCRGNTFTAVNEKYFHVWIFHQFDNDDLLEMVCYLLIAPGFFSHCVCWLRGNTVVLQQMKKSFMHVYFFCLMVTCFQNAQLEHSSQLWQAVAVAADVTDDPTVQDFHWPPAETTPADIAVCRRSYWKGERSFQDQLDEKLLSCDWGSALVWKLSVDL